MKRHHIQRSPSPSFKLDDEDDSYEPYVPVAQRRRQKMAKLYVEKQQKEDLDDNEDAQREEELRKEKARMERTLLIEAQEVHSKKAVEGMFYMLDSSYQVIHLFRDLKKTASEKAEEADAEILEAIKSRRKLASDMELAKGIEYTESLKTRWATTIYSWTCA
jgi:ATP-dependent RNA helicase DDX41